MTKPEQVHFYSNYATRAACMHARLKAAAAAPLAAIRWLVATSIYILLLWLTATATASTTVQCCRQDGVGLWLLWERASHSSQGPAAAVARKREHVVRCGREREGPPAHTHTLSLRGKRALNYYLDPRLVSR